MKCKNCSAENQDKNIYCYNCGFKMDSDLEIENHTKKVTDTIISSVKDELRLVQLEAYEKIQDKALRWLKIQFYGLGIAFTIVIGIFTFFGYSEYSSFKEKIDSVYNSFKEKIDNTKTKIDNDSKTAMDSLKLIETEANNSLDYVREMNEKINPTRMIKDYEDVQTLKKDFRSLQREAEVTLENTKNNLLDTKKFQNSFYSIYIHFPGTYDNFENKYKNLIKSLTDAGFLIKRSNIWTGMEVDKNEIIYYHDNSSQKASEIKSIADHNIPGINCHQFPNIERDQTEILLKLME